MSEKTSNKDYQRGYQAGLRRSRFLANENKELKMQNIRLRNERRERIYMQCLIMSLENCSGWTIDGKKINNAKGYCTLAKIFSENAISNIDNWD